MPRLKRVYNTNECRPTTYFISDILNHNFLDILLGPPGLFSDGIGCNCMCLFI